MITKHHKIIILIIMIFMAISSLSLAWNDSLTFDEVAHIPAGYSYVTLNDYRLNPEHPPLLKVLSGLFLLPLDLTFDVHDKDFWIETHDTGEYGQWDAGRYFLHQAGNNSDLIVFFARMPIVILSISFGVFLFFWGKKIGGIITGLLALIFYAFDPNVLGHNHYVTTDIGIAVAIGVAFYFFLQFLKIPTWRYALYGGVALGVAQITKFSAIMLIPIFGSFLLIYPLIKFLPQNTSRVGELLMYLAKGTFALLIMCVIIWISYAPVTFRMPETVLPPIAAVKGQPDKYPQDRYLIAFINYTNASPLTRPIATYTQGLMQVLNRVNDGNVTYFLGNVSSDASRLYFPFVFMAKQTLIHIFFYTVAFMLFFLLLYRSMRKLFINTPRNSIKKVRAFVVYRFHEIALLSFVVFYSYISISGNLNLGFRHLFPMMPLLYLLTAKTIVGSYKNLRNIQRKRIVRAIFIALIALLIIIVLHAYPYYMSYFNMIFGGPQNGYHFVTDSNADWGQDLKRLKAYLDKHPEIDKIRVDYFGGDNAAHRIGEERFIPWWDSKRPIEPGYYAISVNFLQGSLFDTNKKFDDSYRWTRDHAIIDRVGTSIVIIKVD